MLVLDANILIRAVLGSRVLGLLRKYADCVEFMAPDVVFREGYEHILGILAAWNVRSDPAMATFDLLPQLVQSVEPETFASFETVARERIEKRDGNDWPVLAAAVARGCPNWTEATGFFGCGLAIWTDDKSNGTPLGKGGGAGIMTDEESYRNALEVIHRELGVACLARFLRPRRSGDGDWTRGRELLLVIVRMEDVLESIQFHRGVPPA